MKTLKIFKTAFVLFAMLLALVSCGKKEGENNSSVNNTGEVVVSNGEAKDGDIVLVHYTLFSEEGEKIESSYDVGSPIEFELGSEGTIPGFDEAVHSMKVGEKKSVTLPPEKAYGQRNEEAIQVVPKSELAEFEEMGTVLEKGAELPTMYGKLEIIDVDDENVTIDMNHPMAGKTLIFDIELVEIKDKSEVNLIDFNAIDENLESNTGSIEENTQIANPASENCISLGGELEIIDGEGGQSGICKKDGKECEEWALFRGECSFEE